MIFQYPPWHSIKYDRIGNVEDQYGMVFSLLDEMGSRLNFTYRVITPAPNNRVFGARQVAFENNMREVFHNFIEK